jgi:hypothetical protein
LVPHSAHIILFACRIPHPVPSRDCKICKNPSISLGIFKKEGFDWMGSRKIGIKLIHVTKLALAICPAPLCPTPRSRMPTPPSLTYARKVVHFPAQD